MQVEKIDKDRKGNKLFHTGCAENKVNLGQGLGVSQEGSAKMASQIRTEGHVSGEKQPSRGWRGWSRESQEGVVRRGDSCGGL